ncbi:hypothetical protein CORC01_07416 [Colletotrichum orchidophilum]|uniref:Secreted protein n=1 Tax=Colletotrichum orchidophilum TaxID=1209926 RepID=A0A1G4B7G3_9PEZI|nr:uncharacterized protein CORC01_07416 [Colletotrichum orchidophilum]OHE97361.1 hypothetical protein CORC01_07416 [Colletotrichum orchidophilum]
MSVCSVASMRLCISRGFAWLADAWVCGTEITRKMSRSARLPSLQFHSSHRAHVTAAFTHPIVLEAEVDLWG